MFEKVFDTSDIVMTDRVSEAIEQYGYFRDFVTLCLSRYRAQDWGDIDSECRRDNDRAVKSGEVIMAAYDIPMDAENFLDIQLIIMTNQIERLTTLLFYGEY